MKKYIILKTDLWFNGHFVQSDDDCSTETDVVLKCKFAIGHLSLVRLASKLPRKLSTLS